MTTPTPRVERVKNETDGTPCLVRYMIELPKRIAKLEAERDELKRHAEAMAEELQWIACRYDDSKSTRECAADAYEMKSAAAQALHAYRAAQEKP